MDETLDAIALAFCNGPTATHSERIRPMMGVLTSGNSRLDLTCLVPSRILRAEQRSGMALLIRLMLVLLACASGFVVQAPIRSATASRAAVTTMGAAKDGPFTPIVLAAKVVLGENLLQKLRGKGIALHSQEINKFCAECAFAPPNPLCTYFQPCGSPGLKLAHVFRLWLVRLQSVCRRR